MRHQMAERIARALLYEGYLLYPYRPSVKNRHRWTIGGLYPPRWIATGGAGDACEFQTEFLVTGSPRTVIEPKLRFLHLVKRTVHDRSTREVESLQVGKEWLHGWQEAVEIAVLPPARPIEDLVRGRRDQPFDFGARQDQSSVCGPDGREVGLVIRQSRAIQGMVEASAQHLEGRLYRVTFRVQNLTALSDAAASDRELALLHSLASAHLVLRVRGGEFVSLLDPPAGLERHAAACRNVGVWPVLVGTGTEKDTLLASPIILYDYPQVAAESPGDFFDSTEIDEMLVLRIQTLTQDEKRMMAAVDERARALLERTGALRPEDLLSLHGTMRDPGEGGKE
jgi:hypothetical protein